MKLILPLLFLILAQPASACIGEAQIIARVSGVQLLGTTCFAQIDPTAVKFYSANGACPLALTEILQSGVDVGLRTEDTCSMAAGDTLSGLVVKDQGGQLTLE